VKEKIADVFVGSRSWQTETPCTWRLADRATLLRGSSPRRTVCSYRMSGQPGFAQHIRRRNRRTGSIFACGALYAQNPL